MSAGPRVLALGVIAGHHRQMAVRAASRLRDMLRGRSPEEQEKVKRSTEWRKLEDERAYHLDSVERIEGKEG